MDAHTLKVMEAELDLLEAKASAIRSVIALYREPYSLQPVKTASVATSRNVASANSTITDAILQVARRVVADANGAPVPTTAILAAVEDVGIELIAAVPRNVISSALSRSDEFKANGRVGWTFAQTNSEGGNASDENGEAEASPVAEGEATPSDENQSVIEELIS